MDLPPSPHERNSALPTAALTSEPKFIPKLRIETADFLYQNCSIDYWRFTLPTAADMGTDWDENYTLSFRFPRAGSLLPFDALRRDTLNHYHPKPRRYTARICESDDRLARQNRFGISTRVSSHSVLSEHSSTSFGSQYVRSAPAQYGRWDIPSVRRLT
ncbi:hypothetical protein NPIL_211211 [Nephila pilipes]|uniref:Uncharacterized protein n=1 Tax=Nephila pilipes TaxID=299642 RepID=A0A8X6P5B4_NEPPI|nr:hypothetical protein NPIL_211211 [Nephila pilipes]